MPRRLRPISQFNLLLSLLWAACTHNLGRTPPSADAPASAPDGNVDGPRGDSPPGGNDLTTASTDAQVDAAAIDARADAQPDLPAVDLRPMDSLPPDTWSSDGPQPDATPVTDSAPDAPLPGIVVRLATALGSAVSCPANTSLAGGGAACQAKLTFSAPSDNGWASSCGGSGTVAALCVDDTSTVVITGTSATSAAVACPTGQVPVGGGCRCHAPPEWHTSRPTANGWQCGCSSLDEAYVRCVPAETATRIGLEQVTVSALGSSQTARCPAGQALVGGGCSLVSSGRILENLPDSSQRWRCSAENNSLSQIHLLCARQ